MASNASHIYLRRAVVYDAQTGLVRRRGSAGEDGDGTYGTDQDPHQGEASVGCFPPPNGRRRGNVQVTVLLCCCYQESGGLELPSVRWFGVRLPSLTAEQCVKATVLCSLVVLRQDGQAATVCEHDCSPTTTRCSALTDLHLRCVRFLRSTALFLRGCSC